MVIHSLLNESWKTSVEWRVVKFGELSRRPQVVWNAQRDQARLGGQGGKG